MKRLYSFENWSIEEKRKAKPDFLDLDKDGDKKETMKKAYKEAKSKKGKLYELHEEDMLERGFKKGEYPKQGEIYYWVEKVMKYGQEKNLEPVKVRFDRMDNQEKNDFGYFFIEGNTERWKKGQRVSGDIHGLWKDQNKAYSYSRKSS